MKRFVIFAMVSVMLLSLGSIAYAVNEDFEFYVATGGASDYTDLTKKSDSEQNWYVTPKSSLNGQYSSWQNGITLRFRCRDSAGNAMSNLKSRIMGTSASYGTTFNEPYDVRTVYANSYYRLYVDRAASSVYDTTYLVGTWCP